MSINAIPKGNLALGIIELRNYQTIALEIKLENSTLVALFLDSIIQIDLNYKLGTVLDMKIELEHKFISIIYNSFKIFEAAYIGDGNYFAFGSQLKSNVKNGESSISFGEIAVYQVDLIHANENPYRLLPGNIIDLSRWNLQLPRGGPDTILPRELVYFDDQDYFYVHDKEIVMAANCGGVPLLGSKFPRTEMGELNSETFRASWSSTAGSHSIKSKLAITNLPKKRPKMAIAQMRNPTTNILQLNIDSGTLAVVYNDKNTLTLDFNYVLGKIFEFEILVQTGKISIIYNGELIGEKLYTGSGNFFKFGPYLLTNVVDYGEDPADYGEIKVYSLYITHN